MTNDRTSWWPVHCGSLIREKDGRHVGRVRAINGMEAIVQWVDNGWISALEFRDMVKHIEGRD